MTKHDKFADIEGGCQCGDIRYRLLGEPQTLYLCHCRDCQKQSSSAFGMSLRMARADVEFLQGQPRYWQTVSDRGAGKIAAFCEHCGTRIYNCSGPESVTLNIKAGSLDDTGIYRPVGHMWTDRAQPWVHIEPGMLAYSRQPEDYDELCASWRESTCDR